MELALRLASTCPGKERNLVDCGKWFDLPLGTVKTEQSGLVHPCVLQRCPVVHRWSSEVFSSLARLKSTSFLSPRLVIDRPSNLSW